VQAEPVNALNFARAETDRAIKLVYDEAGFASLIHARAPTPLDMQPVIRMNRDTLYTRAVLDLSPPVTITMTELDGRYQSLQVIDQDHYMFAYSKPGTYQLTQETVGTAMPVS